MACLRSEYSAFLHAKLQLLCVLFHRFDADGSNIFDFHTKHFAATADQITVALCGKFFILEFFHKAGHLHISDASRTHSGSCLNNSGQLVHGKQRFFQICHRFHIIDNAVSVSEDGSDLLVRQSGILQRLCMCELT